MINVPLFFTTGIILGVEENVFHPRQKLTFLSQKNKKPNESKFKEEKIQDLFYLKLPI